VTTVTLHSTATELKGKYAFISLGCPKNLVDSERMLGLLQLDGYQLVDDPDGADFVIINTCGFIEDARNESLATIDEMIALKNADRTRGIIVSGCLAEHQKERLLEIRPEIDALVGVFGREEITRVADRFLGRLDEQRTVFAPAPIRTLPDTNRLRITPRHFAYLKISEGCDRLCTFCGIPQMRGKHATKPIEEIIREATELAADGVRELVLVAQDTTYYGMDLYGEPRLRQLLEQLSAVASIDWIRLMYLYPQYIDDALLDTIATTDTILPYLDLPLQHINDRLLKRMARKVTRDEIETLLTRLRDRIPGLTLRTTMITGFPGETDAEFEQLHQFIKDQAFERLGVFTYSYEPNTPSAQIPDHLPEEVKQQRRDILMKTQRDIMRVGNEQKLRTQLEVILDSAVPEEHNVWIGRTIADAPEVDSHVYVTGNEIPLKTGNIVTCEIVGIRDYDLIAVAIGPVC
jgi:ribosomal protein S12 methylthiotransferase